VKYRRRQHVLGRVDGIENPLDALDWDRLTQRSNGKCRHRESVACSVMASPPAVPDVCDNRALR
jgi:hypothetical protein